METQHWKQGDEFPILDLVARFEYKTSSSLSFELGKTVDRLSPRPPEMECSDEQFEFATECGAVFVEIGWLDVHHPCEGSHPLRLRVGLPDRYVSSESMRDLVPQVKAALGLPADVPYQVDLAGLSQQTFTKEPWDEFIDVGR
jgi:hypothetical protein